jgi:uncharacterized protein YhbP (UPF0306 family)
MLSNCCLDAQGFEQELLKESIASILAANELCSMATVNDSSSPYINTAYYAFKDDLRIYFLSNPIRQHSLNLANNSSIALSIFTSAQPFASLAQGLQIFGDCHLTNQDEARDAFHAFSRRFPKLLDEVATFEEYLAGMIKGRFYEIRPRTIKIFDEPCFGKGIWVLVNVNTENLAANGDK